MPPVAAADAGKATNKSSTTPSPHNGKGHTDTKGAKLCHIVKRADFDGYGFNLHTEKSKPGQYIGKIDANSPAEVAGLKEGDRIIEVNGLPIGNETHKQVVQRIKAIAWEVKLLVTREDPVAGSETKSSSKSKSTKSTKKDQGENKTNPKKHSTTNAKTTTTTANNGSINSSVSAAKNQINNTNASEQKSSTNPIIPTTPTTPPPPLTPPLQSASLQPSTSPTQKSDGTLKLPSTAAEMRAILQSKKKYNPKSDDVNLQKKYDIIQKL